VLPDSAARRRFPKKNVTAKEERQEEGELSVDLPGTIIYRISPSKPSIMIVCLLRVQCWPSVGFSSVPFERLFVPINDCMM